MFPNYCLEVKRKSLFSQKKSFCLCLPNKVGRLAKRWGVQHQVFRKKARNRITKVFSPGRSRVSCGGSEVFWSWELHFFSFSHLQLVSEGHSTACSIWITSLIKLGTGKTGIFRGILSLLQKHRGKKNPTCFGEMFKHKDPLNLLSVRSALRLQQT